MARHVTHPTIPIKPLVLISSLDLGGAERVTVSFLLELARHGLPAALCTVSSRQTDALASELTKGRLTRYDLRARRLADPAAFFRYIRLVGRDRFDVVHAHGQDAGILAAAARPFVRVPLVLTRHVLDEPDTVWRERLRAGWSLAAVRRADAVIAVSSTAADHLSRAAAIPRPTIEVIPNGIDVARFDRSDLVRNRTELRRRIGIAPTDRMVLVVAALRPGKGHEVLIEAWPDIRRRLRGVRIVFAGGGERRAVLEAHCRYVGAPVTFLGWRDDVAELLAASDVVVLPSYSEACPTVLMEAAAAGRPIVATRAGGVAEIVDHGRTGLLVAPGDVSGLAEAVCEILSSARQTRRFGEEARKRATRDFSLGRQVEQTLGVWSSMRQRAAA
jgi:glycosyltransferase involved in cell wall biosynthesis